MKKAQEIIARYKKDPSKENIAKFQESAYSYINSYMVRDDDMRSDFTLHVLQNSEKIINSYPDSCSAGFDTWFNAVLKNQYRTFKRNINDSREVSTDTDVFAAHEGYDESETGTSSLHTMLFRPVDLDAPAVYKLAGSFDIHDLLHVHYKIMKFHTESYIFRERTMDILNKLDGKMHRLSEDQQKRLKNRMYKHMNNIKRKDKECLKIFSELFKISKLKSALEINNE